MDLILDVVQNSLSSRLPVMATRSCIAKDEARVGKFIPALVDALIQCSSLKRTTRKPQQCKTIDKMDGEVDLQEDKT